MSYKYHELKTWPEYFQAIEEDIKTFEVRKNDRNFSVNDILILKEYDNIKQEYTGREITVRVTYIMSGEEFCKPGHVIMAIKHEDID